MVINLPWKSRHSDFNWKVRIILQIHKKRLQAEWRALVGRANSEHKAILMRFVYVNTNIIDTKCMLALCVLKTSNIHTQLTQFYGCNSTIKKRNCSRWCCDYCCCFHFCFISALVNNVFCRFLHWLKHSN